MNVMGAIKQLQAQRATIESEIKRLDSALSVLSGLNGAGKARLGGPRRMSAAARKRIADAQRARWAKWKAAHKKK